MQDFVGQRALREQLAVAIEAAGARGEALDHLLLAGPPGLGKTSLAHIVAAELDVAFVQTAGPALERKGDIAATIDRKSTRLNSSHPSISYAVFCLKKKKKQLSSLWTTGRPR